MRHSKSGGGGTPNRHIDSSSVVPTAKFAGQNGAKSNRRWSPAEQQDNKNSAQLDSYQNGAMVRRRKSGADATDGEMHSEALHVHGNLVLRMTEQCRLCRCWKRWQLAILANVGFMIVFGIRCNFGAAKNHMSKDYVDPWGKKHKHSFNWTSAELGVMESSFFYGYLVTQIPAGFLAAKFPANKMFGLAIGGASFLNILIPHAFRSRSDTMVALVQIAQGLVQGLAYPAMHGVWCHWAPPLERSKLATTAFTGSYAGAVFGLPLSALLVSYVHWSMPFYIYGIAGVIWTFFWFSMTFEKPAFHPTITVQEKQYIEAQIGPVNQSHPTVCKLKAALLLKNDQLSPLPNGANHSTPPVQNPWSPDDLVNELKARIDHNIAKLGLCPLNTAELAKQCTRLMRGYDIGQRLFARTVTVQLPQKSLCDLLNKPKAWHKLTDKNQEAFRRIFGWISDDMAINLLCQLSPRKVALPEKLEHPDPKSLIGVGDQTQQMTICGGTAGPNLTTTEGSVISLVNMMVVLAGGGGSGGVGRGGGGKRALKNTNAFANAPPPKRMNSVSVLKIDNHSPQQTHSEPSPTAKFTSKENGGNGTAPVTLSTTAGAGGGSGGGRWRHDDIPKEKIIDIYEAEKVLESNNNKH